MTLRCTLAVLATTRLTTALCVGVAVVVPLQMAGGDFLHSLRVAAPFVLAAMGGFALNDISDQVADRINKPWRSIPSRRLTVGAVGVTAGVCLALAAVASIASRDGVVVGLGLVAIIGVSVYNVVVRHFGVAKGLVAAFLCATPVVATLHELDRLSTGWWVVAGTVSFVFGRELLMDSLDLEGDREAAVRTLPMVLGESLASQIGFMLLLAGALCLVPTLWSSGSRTAAVLMSTLLVSLLTCFAAWRRSNDVGRRAVVLVLWVPMAMGLLTLGYSR